MTGKFIVGIDEAGRGPLAGPITVAIVATKYSVSSIKYQVFFKNIRDSKKLSVKQRQVWFNNFRNSPKIYYAHSSVGNKTIDKIGIVKATSRAVRNCLRILNTKYLILNTNARVVLDGSLHAPAEYQDQQAIIRGDEKIPIIAAASIIAKVIRDRKMVRFAKKYQRYSFEIHKGYGTKMHREAIRRHGMCDLHRRSFCSKFF